MGKNHQFFFSIQVEVTDHQRSSIINSQIKPHPTVLTPKCSHCLKGQRILMLSLSNATSICLNNLSISFNTLTMITMICVCKGLCLCTHIHSHTHTHTHTPAHTHTHTHTHTQTQRSTRTQIYTQIHPSY